MVNRLLLIAVFVPLAIVLVALAVAVVWIDGETAHTLASRSCRTDAAIAGPIPRTRPCSRMVRFPASRPPSGTSRGCSTAGTRPSRR